MAGPLQDTAKLVAEFAQAIAAQSKAGLARARAVSLQGDWAAFAQSYCSGQPLDWIYVAPGDAVNPLGYQRSGSDADAHAGASDSLGGPSDPFGTPPPQAEGLSPGFLTEQVKAAEIDSEDYQLSNERMKTWRDYKFGHKQVKAVVGVIFPNSLNVPTSPSAS